MSLLAKPVVKNKCWIVEEDGRKVASILSSPFGITLVKNGNRERFSSFKKLKDRYNILVDKTKKQKTTQPLNQIYGYPCSNQSYNILWDVKHRLPIFTKNKKSKSFFCAGYYVVSMNSNEWVEVFCPKLITIGRYLYFGPFKTKEEAIIKLKELQQ